MSGYAGAPDPLVRPDYTGAAPDKPGACTSITVDAVVEHHAEASGENLAQLARKFHRPTGNRPLFGLFSALMSEQNVQ